MKKLGYLDRLIDILKSLKVEYVVFDKILPNTEKPVLQRVTITTTAGTDTETDPWKVISNVENNEKLEGFIVNILEGLIMSLEAHHSLFVSKLIERYIQLAKAMGLT